MTTVLSSLVLWERTRFAAAKPYATKDQSPRKRGPFQGSLVTDCESAESAVDSPSNRTAHRRSQNGATAYRSSEHVVDGPLQRRNQLDIRRGANHIIAGIANDAKLMTRLRSHNLVYISRLYGHNEHR